MSMSGSVSRTTTTQFFVATAVMEAGAGLALLVMPTLVIGLLSASPVTDPAVAVGRLARTAARSLVDGTFVYNVGVIAFVLIGSFGSPSRPVLLVLTLAHGAMAAWCVSLLRSRPGSGARTTRRRGAGQ